METIPLQLADFETFILPRVADLRRLSGAWDGKTVTVTLLNNNDYTVRGTVSDVIAVAAGVQFVAGQRLTLRQRLRGRL